MKTPASKAAILIELADRLFEQVKNDDGKAPTTIVTDTRLLISAEDGRGFADFYGEFRGGYPWIHPKIEVWAKRMGVALEWANPGAVEVVL